jgi:hypothetical protein
MSRDSLVQRLIAFLKKPDALEYDRRTPVYNPYDDYEPQEPYREPEDHAPVASASRLSPQPTAGELLVDGSGRSPGHASRLDALVMRAIQQFNAQQGFVIRHERGGQMRYCTGRDLQGRYVAYTDIDLDRRAVFLALDSGESQFFAHTPADDTPVAVLCGPLRVGDEVIGVLYLDNPMRSRLRRGMFDVFCDQAARMLSSGVA